MEADQNEPPRVDYRHLRELATKAFPGLGLYVLIAPKEALGSAPWQGDAIDDIARDLHEVVWRWENVGPADAAWSFRFNYEIHWGRHLHDLRSYLHAVMFEH